MSAPTSVEEFLQLIRKSGMIDEPTLNSYLQRRQYARGLNVDLREFAEEMVRDGILTNFQAEQFLLGKWRGFTIGKYKLLERVGVGGMGQVFLCEHMFIRRQVAIKVLPPAKAEQPAALGRFYREARAAGSLQHPNIVRTQDIDQDGNLHYIVMEYVDGTNLLDIVKKFGPMDIRRATYYVLQAARGLDYAFRNGIIHRDIKPGNILIDRKGRARLLDMGLARFYRDHNDQLTIKYDDKIVLGTADYVAPEQVANSHAVDIRADIYGLGATFYFLLAGHPPFPTGTVSQKLLWHRTKDPTPIRQVRPEVPEGLAAVISRMMAKDPKARFQTPAQVIAELERWVNPAEVPLPPAEEMPELSPAARAVVDAFASEEGDPEKISDQAVSFPESNTSSTAGGDRLVSDRHTLLTPTTAVDTNTPSLTPFAGVASTSPLGASARPAVPKINPFAAKGLSRQTVTLSQDAAETQPDHHFQHHATAAKSQTVNDNPFPGGDLTASRPRLQSPLLILAVLLFSAAIGATVALLSNRTSAPDTHSPTDVKK